MTATTATPVRRQSSTQAELPVLLVVPSFQGVRCPGLGVSQLKGNLLQAGIPAEVTYLNLRFAERIRPRVHDWLSGTGPYLVGEYVFSHVLHDFTDADLDRYHDEILAGTEVEAGLARWFPGKGAKYGLRWLTEQARDFVRGEAVDLILAKKPQIVGFSSTFQSNCCSLAVIEELKKRRPDLVTVMGGANCEGVMGEELLARYPFVDHVGRGECDKTFVQFVRRVRAGEEVRGLRGFLSRLDEEPSAPSPPLHGPDLDENAHPDFDEYFAELARRSYRDEVQPGLAMETSRGCWWGEKQHCTFCAFNREGMVFRSKAPQRVLDEVGGLTQRYGLQRIELTDNILDMAYFKNLLRDLADTPRGDLFWETKSNLTREQIRLMRKAGIRWIQPGIESLSDLTLKLMRKGASQLQQVQTLKYCTESGIRITWNWLFGFPGENELEMDDLARVVQAIHHLQPPGASPVLYLERYSPYFETPEEWGIAPVRPAPAYERVYPFGPEAANRLAFFFDSDHLLNKVKGPAHTRLESMVQEWTRVWGRSHFHAVPRGDALLLVDTRPCAKRFLRRLTGLKKRVYEFLWKIRGRRDIERRFEGEATPEEIGAILQSFVDDSLVLHGQGDRFLALATDPRRGYRGWPAVFPGGGLRQAGRGRRWLPLLRRPRALAATLKHGLVDRTVRAITRLSRGKEEIGAELEAQAGSSPRERVVA